MFPLGEIIEHKNCKRVAILLSKFYHFEGSCAPTVPFTLKEYCAPNRVRACYSCCLEPRKGYTF